MEEFEMLIDYVWGCDELFRSRNPEHPEEVMYTCFYSDRRNRDKEWSFFIILN